MRCPHCHGTGQVKKPARTRGIRREAGGWRPHIRRDGVRTWGPLFPTVEQARDWRDAADRRLASGRPLPDHRVTVADLADRWLAQHDAADRTRAIYQHNLDSRLRGSTLGRMPVVDVRPMHVQAWVRDLTAAGLSAATVRNVYSPVRSTFTWAVHNELRDASPCVGIRLPSVERRRPPLLTVASWWQLLGEMPSERDRLMCEVGLFCALRISELTGLRVGDVDTVEGLLAVRGTKTAGSAAVLPLPDFLLARLAAFVDGRDPREPLFRSAVGSRVSANNWRRRVWRPAVERAGLPDGLTPHKLRHSCASWLSDGGMDIKAVSEYLRHTRLATTSDVYAWMAPTRRAELVGELERMVTRVDFPADCAGFVRAGSDGPVG